MSIEKPREFVGGNEPYEKLEARARNLAREAKELDEKREQATREGASRRAEQLEEERKRIMEAQRKTLRQISELRKLSLK